MTILCFHTEVFAKSGEMSERCASWTELDGKMAICFSDESTASQGAVAEDLLTLVNECKNLTVVLIQTTGLNSQNAAWPAAPPGPDSRRPLEFEAVVQ